MGDRTYEARKSLGLIHEFRHYKKYFLDVESGIAGDFAYELNNYIGKINDENQALQARVAELEAGFKQMDASLISMGSKGTLMPTINYQEMLRIVGKSPKQSLADIQADAILKATASVFPKCGAWNASIAPYMLSNRNSFIEYANQLRKESE